MVGGSTFRKTKSTTYGRAREMHMKEMAKDKVYELALAK